MTDLEYQKLTTEVLRHAYGMFPSGVTAVCALIDAAPVGFAASSFTSVSLEPPLVSVCVAHTSTTWPILRRAPRLGISVLAGEHDTIVRQLSSKAGDRFADVRWEAAPSDAVFVHGSSLWLDCHVENLITAGDHDIVVLKVDALQPYPDAIPMIFHASQFRQLGPE
jgi:flavin reductase (DIM6/NTAB) family NADH-FMN oxidoreductase RutF